MCAHAHTRAYTSENLQNDFSLQINKFKFRTDKSSDQGSYATAGIDPKFRAIQLQRELISSQNISDCMNVMTDLTSYTNSAIQETGSVTAVFKSAK